ncbi:MAG: hypothetical protein K0S08_287 [Gammaproteobacteria bacterium]|jgi:hypothetical protein|nr:hypothetical protein [Gammaproteobacteria bacterium]
MDHRIKRITFCFLAFYFSAMIAFAQTNNSTKLAPNAIIVQVANANLSNPLFVKRFFANATGNNNGNFTFNQMQVVHQASNNLLQVYPAHFIGLMRYKSFIRPNTVSSTAINNQYIAIINQLANTIQNPSSLAWLTPSKTMSLPSRFYYSPAGYSVLILDCQPYGCRNELAAFYNIQNGHVFGYIEMPHPQYPGQTATYLFGMGSPLELSYALALKARRSAEAVLHENSILANINN